MQTRPQPLAAGDIQALVELVEEQAASGRIRLKPLAIDHQLRYCSLAHVTQHLIRSRGIVVDVDLGVFDAVGFKKLLSLPAISAPVG